MGYLFPNSFTTLLRIYGNACIRFFFCNWRCRFISSVRFERHSSLANSIFEKKKTPFARVSRSKSAPEHFVPDFSDWWRFSFATLMLYKIYFCFWRFENVCFNPVLHCKNRRVPFEGHSEADSTSARNGDEYISDIFLYSSKLVKRFSEAAISFLISFAHSTLSTRFEFFNPFGNGKRWTLVVFQLTVVK